jgi:hypothetical protein
MSEDDDDDREIFCIRIVDENGDPIRGVRVTVEDQDTFSFTLS